jgi:uncharacterized membrane protein YkoI
MLRITSAVVLVAAGFQAAAAAGCYADWSVAAPIVRKEGLATVETLARRAQSKISGDIVKTTLCEEKGGFVYRLVVRDPKGRLSNRTVDARAPFGP